MVAMLPQEGAKTAHFCSMCRPKVWFMEITQPLRECAVARGESVDAAATGCAVAGNARRALAPTVPGRWNARMARAGPIGVFDSGFGGLSVLAAIRAALPGEDLLYCADHAFLPYGEREPALVRARAHAVTAALVDAGARAVVVACNTATAAAADSLRGAFAIPIVAMEPAVKPAAAASRCGIVGVLGTGGTLASARFTGLLERYGDGLRVVARPCPELVVAAESEADPARRRALVAAAVEPLVAQGADVLVLGCTHFAFLRPEIEAVAGPGVTVIDTGPAVARELVRCLRAAGPLGDGERPGSEAFWTSGDAARLEPALRRLWGPASLAPMPAAPRPTAG